MEVKDIINEGRPAEFKFEGKYTFAEIVSLATDSCYKTGVHDGYDYALEEFENNRLKACESQTEAESEREMDFAVKFFEEHHRQPTFSDAIEITRKQMADKACKLLCNICYFGRSASSPHSHCKICKAEGGDYYRFTKLAEE